MKLDKILEIAPSNLSHLEFICGIDEVGRGPGAGPVVTAAVILPKDFKSSMIRDSKKLTEKQRNEAYKLIMDNALSVSCHAGPVGDINILGIDKVTFNTMHKCIDELNIKPEYTFIDGNRWEEYNGTNKSEILLVPKGDDTYTSISAAAIIAKVRRDEYMNKLHVLFPNYNWNSNKGYLTPDHIEALKKFGSTRYHRTLFIRKFV